MKKKHRKHSESLESNEEQCVQSDEVCPHSPLLFEASQDIDVHTKKLKKKKAEQEKQDSWPEDSSIGANYEINDEIVIDASKKKKKKKKQKHHDDEQKQNNVLCIPVNQDNANNQQEMDTALESGDYVNIHRKKKKKKKKKKHSSLEGQNDANELPGLYAFGNECRSQKKGKKMSPCDTQESTDETFALSFLSNSEQNSTSTLKRKDEAVVSGSPAKRHTAVVPQIPHENGDFSKKVKTDMTKDSLAFEENPLHVAADVSQVTSVGDNGSSKETVARVGKVVKGSQASPKAKKKVSESETTENDKDLDNWLEFAESEKSLLGNELSFETTTCSTVDLETARRELEEFIPQVRTMSEKSVLKMAGRDLSRFKKFKGQGIPIKFGRFSQKENNQIRKNVEDFLSLTGIENAEKLLFTYRYPEERAAITRLKIQYMFSVKIAEEIPRPWKLVYFRARKMFDPHNYKGRYSKEEKEKLKQYHAIHGNNWKKISELMSRSALSVAMKYSQIKSQVNSGHWSEEETQKLIQAVLDTIQKGADLEDIDSLLQAKNSSECEKLCKNIPWTEVEAKVGTRYWRQCKQKWISIVTEKMSKGQKMYHGTKGLQAKINLIKRLYEMKVEDANEVNWEELCGIIGAVPEAYVQAKFYKLKATSVPSWHTKTFPEIIDYLYDETLPLLEQRLEKRQKRDQGHKCSQSRNQEAFSKILDDNEDDDSN